jgi:hypothetical protein
MFHVEQPTSGIMYHLRQGLAICSDTRHEARMWDWFNHWRGRLGWALVIFGAAERIIGWGGSIDFLIARVKDPGWVGAMLKFIQLHSEYLGFAFLLLGLFFIVWNERRRTSDMLEKRVADLQPTIVGTLPEQIEAQELTIDGDNFDPPPSTKAMLYAGQAIVSAGDIDSDNRLELVIIAFNGHDFPVNITSVSGHLLIECKAADGEHVSEKMATPVLLTDRTPMIAQPLNEFLIVLHQYVTPANTRAIKAGLELGVVTFDIRNLNIGLVNYNNVSEIVRLPLTRCPNLSKTADGELKSQYTVYLMACA